MNSERSTHRVIKTLAPTDRGAIELARRYGDTLICVRHRTDAKGKVRHTTVELLVSSEPIFGHGDELDIDGDRVSTNGLSCTKNELVDKVVNQLNPDTQLHPVFEAQFFSKVAERAA